MSKIKKWKLKMTFHDSIGELLSNAIYSTQVNMDPKVTFKELMPSIQQSAYLKAAKKMC